MNQSHKTLLPKTPKPQSRGWHLLDVQNQVLGRMATKAAVLLRGKHKPSFAPSVDIGDYVVVTNASRVKITGHKIEQKTYFSHSGYAGGAKVTPLSRLFEKDPRKVVYLAVKRMLPGNRLRSRQLRRLRIFRGATHPYASFVGSAAAAK